MMRAFRTAILLALMTFALPARADVSVIGGTATIPGGGGGSSITVPGTTTDRGIVTWSGTSGAALRTNAATLDASANLVLTAGLTVISPVVLAAGSVSAPSLAPTGDANNGIYFPAADQTAITTAGTQALLVSTSAVTAALPIVAPAGAVGAPALSTAGDLNNGIYFPAADQVAIANAGAQTLLASATAITAAVPIVAPAGAVGAPGISTAGDLNNGLYFPAADQVAIANAGVQSLLSTATGVTTTVPITLPAGSNAAPTLLFTGAGATGLFSTGNGNISVGILGGTKLQIDGNAIYMSNPTRFQNGSVSAPPMTNLNDTNTGWFFPAADQISMTLNGVQHSLHTATTESIFLASRETKTHAAFASSGSFLATGAVQTTNNTQTAIAGGGTITLTDTFVCTIRATVTARQTDASDRASFVEVASVYREGGGATINVAVTESVSIRSAGAVTSSWAATITVSGNDARVSVTGATSETINWVITNEYQCVSGST